MTQLIAIVLIIFVMDTLYARHKPFNKKSYFKKQYKDLAFQLADLEFKRFKVKEDREELRQYYTDLKAKRESLKGEMKRQDNLQPGTEGKLTKDERARLDDDLVKLDTQIKHTEEGKQEGDYVMNLKDFDKGLNELNGQLEQVRGVRESIQEYLQKEL